MSHLNGNVCPLNLEHFQVFGNETGLNIYRRVIEALVLTRVLTNSKWCQMGSHCHSRAATASCDDVRWLSSTVAWSSWSCKVESRKWLTSSVASLVISVERREYINPRNVRVNGGR